MALFRVEAQARVQGTVRDRTIRAQTDLAMEKVMESQNQKTIDPNADSHSKDELDYGWGDNGDPSNGNEDCIGIGFGRGGNNGSLWGIGHGAPLENPNA